ncbi:division plane positioning ATPase MipZ [Paracoccaceae bacterium GXU_MW_L88]
MHVIVFGNEKGGSGKSTTAMHVITALTRAGYAVGAMDLDLRQQSLFRYLDNRQAFITREQVTLPMPVRGTLKPSQDDSRKAAEESDRAQFGEILEQFRSEGCEFALIDCPGADTHYARMAHSAANTLVTPMNDSLIDFDLLARLDPVSGRVMGPSIYSEMVWNARQDRAAAGLPPLDWVVLRNRMAVQNAHNKRKVGAALKDLQKRIGFRLLPGMSERVIFREMFLNGLTLLDLKQLQTGKLSLSNIAARQELRDLMSGLNLPAPDVTI